MLGTSALIKKKGDWKFAKSSNLQIRLSRDVNVFNKKTNTKKQSFNDRWAPPCSNSLIGCYFRTNLKLTLLKKTLKTGYKTFFTSYDMLKIKTFFFTYFWNLLEITFLPLMLPLVYFFEWASLGKLENWDSIPFLFKGGRGGGPFIDSDPQSLYA